MIERPDRRMVPCFVDLQEVLEKAHGKPIPEVMLDLAGAFDEVPAECQASAKLIYSPACTDYDGCVERESITVNWEEPETDEEYDTRVAAESAVRKRTLAEEAKRAKRAAIDELALYEALKKKYDPPQ